jgi:D-serine dehydratase
MNMPAKPYAREMISKDPVFRNIADLKETVWINDKYLPFEMTDALCQLVVSDDNIADAERRLKKFSRFITRQFPETICSQGIRFAALSPYTSGRMGRLPYLRTVSGKTARTKCTGCPAMKVKAAVSGLSWPGTN